MAKRRKPRSSGERPAVPAPASGTGRRRQRIWALAIFIAAIATIGLAFQMWRHLSSASRPGSSVGPTPAFVGRQTCAGCHQKEHALWQGSHHDLAMQKATDATVLGDFKNTTFTWRGLTSTFSRRDGKFFVRTDGPDGKLHEYEIAYTFGVAPLQQYLIAFPGGRYQALSIAWDSRPKSDGGQRWFHLYPDERIAAGDELHWTQPSQNWNFMCAECHSTELRKRYVAADDRYETTWAELNVSCEACHGPGSAHVAWAERTKRGGGGTAGQSGLVVNMDRRATRRWAMNPGTGIAQWAGAASPGRGEVEACGRCHARRSTTVEPYVYGRPLADTHRAALLDQALYHADGQIRDEVYEYGSFLQSKMYARGVTCSDCHDPHSLRLRASGNAVCATCHLTERFDSPSHHHHKPGSAGAQCVNCHMPTRTYMVVDPRRDHSLRVPRPDLSARLGAPDACTGCHKDRTAAWADEAIARWPGASRRGTPHYGEAIALGRRGGPGAQHALADLARDAAAPAIARATALTLLGARSGGAPRAAIEAGLGDADPLVRTAAMGALDGASPDIARSLGFRLLADPVLSVRLEAARVLAGLPASQLTGEERERLERGVAEYRAAQLVNADRPWAHLNLALVQARRGLPDEAEASLRTALRLDPRFVPAYVNLADVMRARGRDNEGERLLSQGLAIMPDSPDLLHAMGLLQVRHHRMDEALRSLGRASELRADNARYAYVYAIALNSTGRSDRALAVLEGAHRRHPADVDVLFALVTINRDRGALPAAKEWARKLAALDSGQAEVAQLLRELGIGGGSP